MKTNNADTFKDVPVSDQGNVRSMKYGKTRILSPRKDKDGYQRVILCREGKNHNYAVHRLVLLAFIGPRPEGMEVCHNNGNPEDNRLCNLRYGTSKENKADRIKHGTMPDLKGSRNGGARLTEEDVREIRRRLATGERHYTISLDFGVSRPTITRIAHGERWNHLK